MEVTPFSLRDHILVTAINAVKLYFLPFKGWRVSATEFRTSNLGIQQDDVMVPMSMVAALRDITCKNQGLLSEYWYESAEQHKQLRIAFNSRPRDREKIASLSSQLISDLNANLFKAVKENFDFLHNAFDQRDRVPPRICIKGYFRTEKDDEIITVYRDSLANDEHVTPRGSNTGFEHVVSKGTYFLCNNIPRAAFHGGYRNPRLNIETIKSDSNKYLSKFKNWNRYWVDGSNQSHYKSTLIVPMTFWNNQFGDTFLQSLDALPDSKRTIFGFLCIDHPKENYFHEELDVSLGYIVADFISMFMFARSVFIELSQTFRKVEGYLNQPDIEIEYDRIFEELRKQISNRSKPRSVREIEESSEAENFIWKFDNELLKYSRAWRKAEAMDAKNHSQQTGSPLRSESQLKSGVRN